jgi:FixJ family two-component response regulator
MARPSSPCVVYIAETDTSVLEALTRLIDSAGLEARPCTSVQAFLDAAAADKAVRKCALFDLGDRTLRTPDVRARLHRLSAAVPLVALTVKEGDEILVRARELGAYACFRKPVDAAALLDAILWVTQPPAQVS